MADKLIVYDSYFGNTEKVARAIADAIGGKAKKVDDVISEDLVNLKILFVGSPTRAFRPTPAVLTFIKSLDPARVRGVKAAVFDTRFPEDKIDSGFLRLMVNIFGYADQMLAKKLKKKGAAIALDNEGFGVKDTEGPLIEGELERAIEWAKKI